MLWFFSSLSTRRFVAQHSSLGHISSMTSARQSPAHSSTTTRKSSKELDDDIQEEEARALRC